MDGAVQDLEEHMLGALRANEEQVPVPNDGGQPPIYDFFWAQLARPNAFSPAIQRSW
jgi:hypothetical protein